MSTSSQSQKNGPPATAGRPPLEGVPLILLTIILPLATFMQVLDTTIANVAIPTIAGNLGASSSQGTWVITSYAVANAIALPITGWLARRFGEVRLFLWSTVLFTITSFLCGIASNIGMLVLFRVLQGALGGPMMPLAQSLLLNNYPPERRSMAIALWVMTVSVAPIFGPLLGGYISDNYDWGWIFFMNVPLGVIVFFFIWRLLRSRETPCVKLPINSVGLGLLVIGVGSLQMMLDRGKELDWFNSPEIIVLAVLAVVGITLLLAWELTDKNPIMDFRLFASRNFTVGVTCISLGMMIYLGTVVLLPLLLQTQFGYTATLSGIVSAPIGIFPVILAPIIGKYSNRIDLRYLISFGFLVFAGAMFMRTNFAPDADVRFVLIPQVIQGIALACFFAPLTNLAFTGLSPEKIASASSMFNFLRTLFGAIGTSIVTTLWERREAMHHTHITEHIDVYNPLVRDTFTLLQNLGMSEVQSAGFIARQVTRQGFILGAAEVYWLCGIAFMVMVGLIWFARSTKAQPA